MRSIPELNPITRRRLWYIAAFLGIDGIVSLYVATTVPPSDGLALPSILFGLVMLVAAGSIGSVLVATKIGNDTDLKRQRTRE